MDYPNDREVLETLECARTVKFRSVVRRATGRLLMLQQLSLLAYVPYIACTSELNKDVSSDR